MIRCKNCGTEMPSAAAPAHACPALGQGRRPASDILDPARAQGLAAQWEAWERVFPTLDPNQQGSVVRWLLVVCFGSEERWHYDAAFHAQVEHAARSLERLISGEFALERHSRSWREALPRISDEQQALLAELGDTRRRARS